MKQHLKGRHCCGRNAEVEGDVFRFKGVGGSVGVVKILEPMHPMLNYFEYEILDKGQKATIGIGVGEHKYPLDQQPGWNRNAIGYHADDGRLYHHDGFGRVYGPTCTTGDRMGCGIDFSTELSPGYVNVFFTRNGKMVADMVKVKRPLFGLYPLVGMHSAGEKVRYLGHSNRVPGSISEPMEVDSSPQTHWLRSNAMRFVEDGLTIEYDGDGLARQDVGIAQAAFPLSPANHYFELEILDVGKEGWIAIGLAKNTYSLTKHPGWCEGSVGYHADNGQLYKEKGQGDPFGPECHAGDLMGCGIRFPIINGSELADSSADDSSSDSEPENIGGQMHQDPVLLGYDDEDFDYDDLNDDDGLFGRFLRRAAFRRPEPLVIQRRPSVNRTRWNRKCVVFFTRNGEVMGETECSLPRGGFYPVVAMLSEGEKIQVNLRPLSG